MSAPRDVVLLGATGSIGTQALDVVARNPGRFTVTGLAAGGSQPALLADQVERFGVPRVAVADARAAAALHDRLTARGVHAVVEHGADAVTALAGAGASVVLNGITGAAGLRPTLAALRVGSLLALANKESLVIGGPVVKAAAAPGQLVPVDSEHSAVAQALRGGARHEVLRLVLTASGGPFRGWDAARLAGVTPAQALAHPTWSMGPMISVNSATLMNKGLEVIEAHLLFDVPLERIDVVVHPQSVVHSMVEFTDGSTLAQASPPDMRLPIALGLAWPDRVPGAAPGLSWRDSATWTFEPVDEGAFGALRLAREAGRAGGTAPAVLNAANEAAVEAFLGGRLDFPGIVRTVGTVLAEHLGEPAPVAGATRAVDLEAVERADEWGRRRAAQLVAGAVPQNGSPSGAATASTGVGQ